MEACLTVDQLRAASVKLHPGAHDYRLSYKTERGFFDADGFWSDEECDAFLRLSADEKRELEAENWRWRRMPLAELRAAYGLMVEVDPSGPRSADKNEVRRRVDIVELAGQFTRLRVVGDRATGRCPFHDDRLASFSVDRKKGLWHCFAGCGGGDVFSLLMARFDVPFAEAVDIASRL